MKTTDIGFERFEEEFYADPSTAFIKPKNLDEYTQIVHPSSEQRKKFYKRKIPYVKDAWERYIKKMKAEGSYD